MFRGPFSLQLSKKAEKLDIQALPEQERGILTHGIQFSPEKHDAYRFFVLPKIEILEDVPARRLKRVSFEQVNRVLVDVETSGQHVSLLGMYPTTLLADGRWEFDFQGEAVLNPVAPGVGGLKLSALGKRLVRQRARPQIKAHRADDTAQWLFFEEWLRAVADFRLELLCQVAKNVEPQLRHLRCNVKFADDGRTLAKLENQVVFFPA